VPASDRPAASHPRPASAVEIGRSVYGLRIYGLDDVAELTAPPAGEHDEDAPTVRVSRTDADRPAVAAMDADRNVLLLADGRHLEMARQTGTARFYGSPLEPDRLAHPYLGPVATTFNRWAGRETFHAGAFVVAGRAWVVAGVRSAGKSTLLAALADRDIPVLSDDITVTDGAVVFAGPRCIDLRQPLPGSVATIAASRLGTRLRVPLPPVADRVPIGGWIQLGWGPPTMTRVRPDVLLRRLAARRSWGAQPSDPRRLLDLAGLPAWDLTRQPDWTVLSATVDLLVGTLTRGDAVTGEAA
jgi:hypothetical protein